MEGLEKTIVWYIENEDWWKSIVKRQSLDDGFARKNI
jgi:dTDP-D-glucose 4,6-dehydratase